MFLPFIEVHCYSQSFCNDFGVIIVPESARLSLRPPSLKSFSWLSVHQERSYSLVKIYGKE